MRSPDYWEVRRSVLIHDGLQNQFAGRIRGFRARLGQEGARDAAAEFLHLDLLPLWADVSRGVEALLADFRPCHSPRRLFQTGGILAATGGCSPWLNDLADFLWRRRSDADRRVLQAHKVLERGKHVHDTLAAALQSYSAGASPSDDLDGLTSELLAASNALAEELLKLGKAGRA